MPVEPGAAMTVATATEPCADATLAAELERLALLVSVVLNEHANQEGLCAVGALFRVSQPCWPSATPALL